jgi:MinD-like ATPase involved in chromosome partitioning or flagellar assembly
MYVVTFYSFKGGVGRTQALVNSAAFLAARKRKVLLVDFDLEAPGLWDFEGLRLKKKRPGLLDFVQQYQRSDGSVPDASDFISTAQMGGPAEEPALQVDVMLAGDRKNYSARYAEIDFDRLYKAQDGWALFEDLRAQWAQQGYDYVLIDSRTGYGEVSGICTLQLADCVTMVSSLAEASIRGVVAANDHIRDRAVIQDRVLVVSRIPRLDDDEGEIAWRLEQLEAETGLRPMPVHTIDSLGLLTNAVVTELPPSSRTFREYLDVSWRIAWNNLDDPLVACVRGIAASPQFMRGDEYFHYRMGDQSAHAPIRFDKLWVRLPSFSSESLRDPQSLLKQIIEGHQKRETQSEESRQTLAIVSHELFEWHESGALEPEAEVPSSDGGSGVLSQLFEPARWRELRHGVLERTLPQQAGATQQTSGLSPVYKFLFERIANLSSDQSPLEAWKAAHCVKRFLTDPTWKGARAAEACVRAANYPRLSVLSLADLGIVTLGLSATAVIDIVTAVQSQRDTEQNLLWGRRKVTREVVQSRQSAFPVVRLGSLLLRFDAGRELLRDFVVGRDRPSGFDSLEETGSIVRAIAMTSRPEELSGRFRWLRRANSDSHFRLHLWPSEAKYQLVVSLLWAAKRAEAPLELPESVRMWAKLTNDALVSRGWNFVGAYIAGQTQVGENEFEPDVRERDGDISGTLGLAALALQNHFEKAAQVGAQLLDHWQGTRWVYRLMRGYFDPLAVRAVEYFPMSILTLRPVPLEELRREVEYVTNCCRTGIQIQWGQAIDELSV